MESIYKVKNIDDNKVLDLFIFEEIDDFWGIGKTAILNELQNNSFNQINLNISSPGGSVDDAFAMFDLIKGSGATVTANLSGIVASAATVIALSADKVVMSENCLFMIHNASTGLWANKEQMAEAIEIMEKFDNRIANIYQKKTGLPIEQVKDLMTAESWLSPDEALQLGFVDEISEQGLKLAAKFDLKDIEAKGFKNIPKNINQVLNINSEKMKLENVFNTLLDAFKSNGVEVTDEHKGLISEVENSIKEQFEASLKESEVANAEVEANLVEANEKVENLLNKVENLEVEANKVADLEAKVSEYEAKLAIENAVETDATPEKDADVESNEVVNYLDGVADAFKNRYSRR